MEIDFQESPKPKKNKKRRHALDEKKEKKEKKRKHSGSDYAEQSSPTKKQKHSNQQPSPSLNTHSEFHIQDRSPFHQITSSLYLPLSPIAQNYPIQGLCAEHLSPLLLTYFPPFHGVIISYSNPRCSDSPIDSFTTDGRQKAYTRCVDEYAATYVWLTADFLLFKPEKGALIEGFISLQNESNLGLVCWNFFSASIERKRLPKDWTWVPGGLTMRKRKKKLKRPSPDGEMDVDGGNGKNSKAIEDDEGHFQDADGNKIEGTIQFAVHDVDTAGGIYRENGFLSIYGTMSSEDDGMLFAKQRQKASENKIRGQKDSGRYLMARALANGTGGTMDVDDTKTIKQRSKH